MAVEVVMGPIMDMGVTEELLALEGPLLTEVVEEAAEALDMEAVVVVALLVVIKIQNLAVGEQEEKSKYYP